MWPILATAPSLGTPDLRWPDQLLLTIKQALQAYRDQTSWQVLMKNGMNKDFSWSASARGYGKVYERVRQSRGTPATSEKVLA